MASREPGTVRAAVARVAAAPAPVLNRGGGAPLDPVTRAKAEHDLGHDFSRVRVHTDADAARSAGLMGARAFALGDRIAFAAGRYAPHTAEGSSLLRHELGHVAERAPTIGFQLDPSVLPGFDQGEYGSCGAASIVTALVLWDRENRDPTAPNNLVVTACDIALVYLDDHKRPLIKKWEALRPGSGEEIHELLSGLLTEIRDEARAPGAALTQQQFEEIGLAFYTLHRGGGTGMGREAREALAGMLGLTTERADNIASFDDIFTAPAITGLKPGRIAQISWYVILGASTLRPGNTRLGPHAFLIGRLKTDGTWFLSDQGASPAVELQAPDLSELKKRTLATKRYWTGPPPFTEMFGQPVPVAPDKNQVLLLADRGGVQEQAKTLVLAPGEKLAEVDAGWLLTVGEVIEAGDFVTRAYSEAAGLAALSAIPAGRGGVMVENPVGLFHIHETTTVSDADNLAATTIDTGDSAGKSLDPDRGLYYSAWLRLSSPTTAAPKPFKVY